MESVLMRLEHRLARVPGVSGLRAAAGCAAYFGGGMLLSAARIWGQMQPIAIGLTLGSAGWRCICAALGCAVGYRLFWGEEGVLGCLWALSAAIPALISRDRRRMGIYAACLTAGGGLAMQLLGRGCSPELFVLRACIAFVCGTVSTAEGNLPRWAAVGAGVLALAGLRPWLGWSAASLAAVAFPIPAAVLAALGSDLGAPGSIPMTAVAGLSFFLRIPAQKKWLRVLAPGAACGAVMVLCRVWNPAMLPALLLGGAAALLIPQRNAVIRRGSIGAVQVHLEQTARVLGLFQRQLLACVSPEPDIPALTRQLRDTACGSCTLRETCPEQHRLEDAIITCDAPFPCRRPGQITPELHHIRETLHRIRADRAARDGYRMALVQQYGFLADTLQALADRLTEKERCVPRFRILVSARSRGREIADGDRVSAFPGTACKYYVLLCDGMGTGLGAAEQSREAVALMRRMLCAGMPPETVLGSINSQLTLTNRGGAVTIDLAEIRLDSGRVWLYKWGAAPSWILRRQKIIPLGSSGPPPGLGINTGRENVSHAALDRDEMLLLLSDGIRTDHPSDWLLATSDPAILAAHILTTSASCCDDATVAVIRLVPAAGPPASSCLAGL